MKQGQVVAIVLFSVGAGLIVYYGFIHKFADGLTFIPHMKNQGGGSALPPATMPPNYSLPSKPDVVTADMSIHDSPSPSAINAGDFVYASQNNIPVFASDPYNATILYSKNAGDSIGIVDSFTADKFFAIISTPSQQVKVAVKYLKR